MLITGGRGYVETAVYDGSADALVEYGRVDVRDLEGLTVWLYDWQFMEDDNQ